MRLPLGLRGAMALVTGLTACARMAHPEAAPTSDAEVGSTEERSAPAPDAELQSLDQCSEVLDEIQQLPVQQRIHAIAQSQARLADCGALLLSRCGLEPPIPADALGRTSALIDACLQRYCPRLTRAGAPALCEADASEFLALPSGEQAQAQAQEFFAAMLALDFGRPRTDAAIERVSRRLARLWSAPVFAINVAPPRMEPSPTDPLQLQVSVGPGGMVLRGEGIDPIEIAAGDLDRLRTEAERLHREHPDAHQVTLRAEDSVPMQHLIDVMDTLRGDHCDEGENAPGCMFPRVIVEVPAELEPGP